MSQWNVIAPRWVGVIVSAPDEKRPVSKLLSSAVAVWFVLSSLVKVTLSPRPTCSGIPSNMKFLMVMLWPPPPGDAVADVGVVAVVAAVVAVVAAGEPERSLPQPATTTTTPRPSAGARRRRWFSCSTRGLRGDDAPRTGGGPGQPAGSAS